MPLQQQTKEIKLSLKWVELIPRPTLEEVDHITASIKKFGLQTPVTVDQNMMLLDGYTRYKVCKRLSIPVRFNVKNFVDDNARTDFVLISNVERRHLKPFDRVRLFRHIYDKEIQKAKIRQGANMRGLSGLKQSKADKTKHGSVYRFAKKIGVGEHTAKRALVVLDEAKDKEIDMVRKGVISITSMYNTVQQRKRRMDEHQSPFTITIRNEYKETNKVIKKRLTKLLYDQLVAYVERM